MTLYAHYVLAQNEATATEGSGASAAYSGSAQNVSLSAQVISTLGTVNEGTMTFSLLDGTSANDPTVGTATSAQVVNGAASVVYGLPAGLPAGSYLIDAVYSDPTGSLTGSGDEGKELTVATAPTTTTGVTTTDYTGSAQNVPLTAQVTSGVGTVNEGTVTFALLDGSEQSVTVSRARQQWGRVGNLGHPGGPAKWQLHHRRQLQRSRRGLRLQLRRRGRRPSPNGRPSQPSTDLRGRSVLVSSRTVLGQHLQHVSLGRPRSGFYRLHVEQRHRNTQFRGHRHLHSGRDGPR